MKSVPHLSSPDGSGRVQLEGFGPTRKSEGRGFESLLGLQNRRSEGMYGIADGAAATGGHSFELIRRAAGAPPRFASLRRCAARLPGRAGLGRRRREYRLDCGRPARPGGRLWAARLMRLRRHSPISV
jgi:hypothetical protein